MGPRWPAPHCARHPPRCCRLSGPRGRGGRHVREASFETDEILRELERNGGHVVFLRDDIMRDQSDGERLEALDRDGLRTRALGTEPMPHLPHHPECGEEIEVQYFVQEVE